MSSMNSALRCERTKIDGTPCGSPALPTSSFCFFHDRFREQHITLNQKPSGPAAMVLPVFEDAASIQIALWEVTRFLLTDQIDHKKAGLVLYALQTASSNLARMAKLAKDAAAEEDWSDVNPDSLWTVLGIDKEEVLRVDRESKAAEAERQKRQFKMNGSPQPQAEAVHTTEGQPVGDIKAVADVRRPANWRPARKSQEGRVATESVIPGDVLQDSRYDHGIMTMISEAMDEENGSGCFQDTLSCRHG